MYKPKTTADAHQRRPLMRTNTANPSGNNNSHSNSSSSTRHNTNNIAAAVTDSKVKVGTAAAVAPAKNSRSKHNLLEQPSVAPSTSHSHGQRSQSNNQNSKYLNPSTSTSERDVMAHRRGARGETSKANSSRTDRDKNVCNDIVSNGRKKAQGEGSSSAAAGKPQNNHALEMIVLSDSESMEDLSKLTTQTTDDSLNNSPESPKTPPAKDLQSYYRRWGLTLSHVRKLNRNYVRHDGLVSEAGGKVFWDSYSPPPGFTMDDVPLNESQGEPVEEVISPAILNAERYKSKPKPRFKIMDSEEELQDLLNKLKRKARNKENDNILEHPKKKSTPDQELPLPLSPEPEPLNVTFPEVADDFNDSELMMFTQAAELEYQYSEAAGAKNSNKNKTDVVTNQPIRKTNVQVGMISGPINTSTPLENPVSARTFRNIGIETPKSLKSVGRNLRSRRENDSNSSLFESSSVIPITVSNNRNSNRDVSRKVNIPRKSLFSGSKSSGSPITSGDFADDDNDFIFSQLDLPQEGKLDSKTDKRKEKDVAEASTQLINQTDSFMLRSDFLNEIDKLEEMAIAGSIESCDKNTAGHSNASISLADEVKRQHANAPGNVPSKTKNSDSPASVRSLRLGRGYSRKQT